MEDPIAALATRAAERGLQVVLLVLDGDACPPLDYPPFRDGAKVSTLDGLLTLARAAADDDDEGEAPDAG